MLLILLYYIPRVILHLLKNEENYRYLPNHDQKEHASLLLVNPLSYSSSSLSLFTLSSYPHSSSFSSSSLTSDLTLRQGHRDADLHSDGVLRVPGSLRHLHLDIRI